MRSFINNSLSICTVFLSFLTGGCATSIHGTPTGFFYAKQKGPVAISSTQDHSYNGNSYSLSKCIFGFYCWGDASIEAAISSSNVYLPNVLIISHIDYEYTNIFGFSEYKTIVYFFDKNSDIKHRANNE